MTSTETPPRESARVAAGDLDVPEELSGRRLRSRLLFACGLLLAVIAVVTLLPGPRGAAHAPLARQARMARCSGWL